jgi:pSer/pThr/pTyr-binding forkhead associated (FHA) protein
VIVVLKVNSSTGFSEITITADKSVTVGRSNKSDHIIGDVMLSGAHCRFTLKPPMLEIKDLESKNGTFLNGLKIDQANVFAGDEILVGNTKITVLLDKMDDNSARAMHFPGDKKDRVAHELKLDVDNSYHLDKLKKDQGFKKPSPMEKNLMAKKAASKTKPTKQEVKRTHKGKASFANTLDIVLFFAVMALPLIFTNVLYLINPQLIKSQRLVVLLLSEIGTLALFFFLNYKFMKFTLGEKISGIAALCEDEND